MGCVTQPAWLTKTFYVGKIQPRIAPLSNSTIAAAIGVSRWYAEQIRKGHCRLAALRHKSLRIPPVPVTELVFVTGDDLSKSTSLITASSRFRGRPQVIENNSTVIPLSMK